MKKVFAITIIIIFNSLALIGQNINVAKLDSFLTTLASKDMAMGSLAIAKDGVVKYQRAIGYSLISNNNKTPADKFTQYRIGSATKMFTAVMIFQLVEEGKLKLDQKLSTFFPQLPNADKITISDLLYHRSGLHDYTKGTDFNNWMDKPKSHDQLLKIIIEKRSDFEPGIRADYSNSNYLVLGYIIERVCKVFYAEVLKERILSRLNLKNSWFGQQPKTNAGEVYSYKYGNGNWAKEKQTDLTIHGGAGSMVSTPADMVTFIDALFSNKIISGASLEKMQTMIDGYGMGIFSNKYGSKPSFGHNGRVEEFYSAMWYFPDAKLSIVYCTNGINYPRTDLIEGILKICFN
jgi:D-alanyl-D-alanine carboxypeptidase